MTRLGFRTRLFGVLSLFALVPSIALTIAWGRAVSGVLPLVSGGAAWDRVAATGERAISLLDTAALTPPQRAALAAHEREIAESVTQARRARVLAARAVPVVSAAALIGIGLLVLVTSRVGNHLSRQLSRPLHELVGWTERISRGEPIPEVAAQRGAPEFELLRARMREMARAVDEGRRRALEAERLRAFRESARQVAHELKNPLTPIRFAVARLSRQAPPELADAVEVLAIETQRLERLARSFAQFGRLPEGPVSAIDLAELARYTAQATVPPGMPLRLALADDLPLVPGRHDAIAGALSNVILNAVDACAAGGGIEVRVTRGAADGAGLEAIDIAVRDTGCGMTTEQMQRMWEPYVTHKPGGTGLGLAVAREAIVAHGGRVSATSAPGEGTEVRFSLPVNDADHPGGSRGNDGNVGRG